MIPIQKYKKILRAKKSFHKYKAFLKSGIYELNDSASCFSEVSVPNGDVRDFSSVAVGKRGGKRKLRVYVDQLESRFSCTKMLITGAGETIKCFDFSENVVFSLFRSEKILRDYIKEREDASSFFPMPAIKDINYHELFVIEERLTDTVLPQEKWESLWRFYSQMISCADISNTSVRFPLAHCNKKTVSVFGNYYRAQGVYPVELPMIFQHGDLWSANVFCNNTQCKMIDFGTFGKYMFFYDLALYMFTEAFILKNDTLLKRYLNGMYDFYLQKMCADLGLDFLTIGREVLFVCAMEEMIFRRFNSAAGKKMVTSILDFLNKNGIDV